MSVEKRNLGGIVGHPCFISLGILEVRAEHGIPSEVDKVIGTLAGNRQLSRRDG